jgi:hypothetical protein
VNEPCARLAEATRSGRMTTRPWQCEAETQERAGNQ